MELVFDTPPGQLTRGVRLRFANPDAMVLSYQLVARPAGTTLDRLDVFSHGAEVTWSPAVKDAQFVLRLELSEGEPEVARMMWTDEYGTPWADVRSAEDAILLDAKTVWELATRDTLLDCVRTALLGAIPQSSHAGVRKAQQFFCELDFSTNRKLIDLASGGTEFNKRRTRMCDDLGRTVLLERVLRRLDAAVAKPGSIPDEWPDGEEWPEGLEDIIREVSRFQLDIYHRHFGIEGGDESDFNVNAVWDAYMLFANGELRMPGRLWEGWNAEPDGAMFFFFAEFAFLACARNVNLEAWKKLLPPLVAAQRVHMHTYRPPGDPLQYRFTSYISGNYSARRRLRSGKDLLRLQYDGLSLDQLKACAGQNAREAFPASARVKAPGAGS